MGFANESGYTPQTIETILDDIRLGVNEEFGTTYTAENFIGTNFYRYLYQLAQRVQRGEIKTSEIFDYLQDYIAVTNERISRPVATSPGIIEALETAGFIASVKPMVDADAGKINICLDLDDGDDTYAADKLEVCTLIKNSIAGGVVSQGAESEAIVLSNGQSFDFKFHLPTLIPVTLRLTTTLSENNQVAVGDPEDVKQLLFDNLTARYRLGKNFQPQTYFTVEDAPWAESVLLEWNDGGGWESTVYDADFDELFDFDLGDITLVEA